MLVHSTGYKLSIVPNLVATLYEPGLHVPLVQFVKTFASGWQCCQPITLQTLPPGVHGWILTKLFSDNGTQSNNNLHGTEIPNGQPVQVVQL